MPRHDRLAAFLRRAASEPRVAGHWDCAMTVANWVEAETGRDPAPHLRGAYTDAAWPRIVERAGGLVALVGGLAEAAGLAPTDAPEPGDIAVVDTPVGPAGAIRTEVGWAMKLDRGITVSPRPTLLAAWKV